MALLPFKNINPDDPLIDKLEQNVSDAFSQVLSKRILDGVYVADVALIAGKQNLISHKLMRKPYGFIVVKKKITTDIWMNDVATTLENLFIDIRTGSNATVSLWVF